MTWFEIKTSLIPPSTKASASLGVCAQMPVHPPMDSWRRANSGHLWALPWGRILTPDVPEGNVVGSLRKFLSKTSKSTTREGVSDWKGKGKGIWLKRKRRGSVIEKEEAREFDRKTKDKGVWLKRKRQGSSIGKLKAREFDWKGRD